MSYINETDFVIENKELVYPEIVTDGLQLYYDAKGKRDTDYHRDTMLDMSGNKNHGKLHNFAYEKHSGYKDGLVFDYIDDKLVRPALDLKPNDFTFMLNGNIISFSPDGTVKRVQDGEVIESKGFNLVTNGDFIDGRSRWSGENGSLHVINNSAKITSNGVYSAQRIVQQGIPIPINHKFYFYFYLTDISQKYARKTIQLYAPNGNSITSSDETVIKGSNSFLGQNNTSTDTFRATIAYISSEISSNDYFEVSNVGIINLTKTFGAGNEPTKEEMDEIINRFGFVPNAQDLIDRIEYKGNDLGDMENIIDGLYKTEVLSGEEIYTDKADDSVVHADIDGKSYQHAGSGKNLFNATRYVSENIYAGSIYSAEEDGSLTIRGVDSTAPSLYQTIAYLKPDTDYVMSFSDRMNDRFEFADASGNSTSIDRQRYGNILKFTTNSTTTRIVGKFYPIEQRYPLNVFVKIEEGSVATEYEPPSPTPDYPIEINSLNDVDVVSSVGGRNIFQLSKFEDIPSSSSSVVSLIKDGFRLTNTYGYGIGFANPDLKPGKTYTISGEVIAKSGSGNGIEGRFVILTKDATKAQSIMLYSGGKGKFTSTFSTPTDFNYNNYYALYAYGISTKADGIPGVVDFINIKIEEGKDQTAYSLSPEEISEKSENQFIDKINLLLDEPLRSVGDVKDRLFRDSDGLWKVERNIAETDFKNRSFRKYGGDHYTVGNRHTTIEVNISNRKLGMNTSIMSHLPNLGFVTQWDNPYSTGYSDHNSLKNIYLYMPNDVLGLGSNQPTNIVWTAFNNWVNAKNPKLVYVLEATIIEILPQSLQEKLNNLRSFEESNYVYTVLPNENNHLSENLKPTLHAKFLYNNWYKEDRVINNLMIYNRALTNQEMLQNYKTTKRRWGM